MISLGIISGIHSGIFFLDFSWNILRDPFRVSFRNSLPRFFKGRLQDIQKDSFWDSSMDYSKILLGVPKPILTRILSEFSLGYLTWLLEGLPLSFFHGIPLEITSRIPPLNPARNLSLLFLGFFFFRDSSWDSFGDYGGIFGGIH